MVSNHRSPGAGFSLSFCETGWNHPALIDKYGQSHSRQDLRLEAPETGTRLPDAYHAAPPLATA